MPKATQPPGTDETICALATPGGAGAIGIIRISGCAALDILGRLTGRGRFEPRRMVGVTLRDPRDAGLLDHALVCFMPRPRSFTGEDVVELQGHGGRANMQRLLDVVIEQGARLAVPGEFTRRAFLNGRLDLTQAEGVAQIIAASSERALRNAQAVLAGGLRARLEPLRRQLVEIAADLEASLDFAEDTAHEPDRAATCQRLARVEAELERLARSYERGRRLDGVRVALTGPVNAGKSTLFNQLLGHERALVSPQPGTTRDYLEATLEWEGVPVTLIDTAGYRPEHELGEVERDGRRLARDVVEQCDLRLEVIDLSAGRVAASYAELDSPELHPPVVVAANKADMCTASRVRQVVQGIAVPAVATSALSGSGLRALMRQVVRVLFPDGADETVAVTRQRQWEALERARVALREAALAQEQGLPPEVSVEPVRETLRRLDDLLGERYTEDVLDQVFSAFCVGK